MGLYVRILYLAHGDQYTATEASLGLNPRQGLIIIIIIII